MPNQMQCFFLGIKFDIWESGGIVQKSMLSTWLIKIMRYIAHCFQVVN